VFTTKFFKLFVKVHTNVLAIHAIFGDLYYTDISQILIPEKFSSNVS